MPTQSLYMFHAESCGDKGGESLKKVPKTQLTSGLSYLEFLGLSTVLKNLIYSWIISSLGCCFLKILYGRYNQSWFEILIGLLLNTLRTDGKSSNYIRSLYAMTRLQIREKLRWVSLLKKTQLLLLAKI